MACPPINQLDHLVLTVRDPRKTCGFYTEVLGFKQVALPNGQPGLRCGRLLIKLHQATAGTSSQPVIAAKRPTPGSADLCFVCEAPIDEFIAHLFEIEMEVELGPVPRHGAHGDLYSVYLRDPDGNLVEVAARI